MEGEETGNPMARAMLIYDGECPMCLRARDWVAAHAEPGAIDLVPCQSEERETRAPQVSYEACMEAMQLVTEGGDVYSGPDAFPPLLARTRNRKWLAWAFNVPGMGLLWPPLYRWIARHRLQLSGLFASKEAHERCRIDEGCD